MPLAKNNNGKSVSLPKVSAIDTKSCCQKNNDCCKNNCCGDFGKKIIKTLAGILLVYVIFYVGTLVHNNLKKYEYIGKAEKAERTMTITGYGKVNGTNDIAVTTIGYTNTDQDVSKAQVANKKVMDAVIQDLKAMSIVDKDMQSDYSIYPEYTYTSASGSVFKGYKVTNQVTIKIRDLSKIQNVLSLSSKYGANQISGLSFTIDDPENLKEQARTKALADAQKKAKIIAQSMGTRLGGVISYSEYETSAGNVYPVNYARGGSLGAETSAIVSGSKDVEMSVSITYELK